MSRGFRRGVWAVLFGEAVAAAAVIAVSPRARDAARPYLVQGIRRALALGEEIRGMIDEAKVEAAQIVREIDATQALADRR
jgi:hypothetical protein